MSDLVSRIAHVLSQKDSRSNTSKELITEIVHRLAQPGGKQVAEELYNQLGFSDSEVVATEKAGLGKEGRKIAESIGVWQREQRDGEVVYVRSMPDNIWSSDVPEIKPKADRKRIVFLGESVARGYLYANDWTPALLLEKMLASTDIPRGVEVLDLTFVSLGLNKLVGLLQSCLQFNPDLIIVFAGNNWAKQAHNALLSSPAVAGVLLRERGITGLKARLEKQLEDLVANRICKPLAKLSAEYPIVFILPEFNLADWQYVDPRDVPLLRGESLEHWLSLSKKAEAALASSELDSAESLFARMTELDGGTATLGLVGQAECKRRVGAVEEAGILLRKARDCRILDRMSVPSSYSVIESTMRDHASRGNFAFVDLPKVFEAYLEGSLPDRRVFLDFCHLTSEGIRIAMAAAAEVVTPLMGGSSAPSERFLELDLSPSADIEASAHFLAAILNAHRGQRYEIVRFHCETAMEADPKITTVMRAYLEKLVHSAPLWLSRVNDEMQTQFSTIRRNSYVVDHWVIGRDCFDSVLFEALADTLGVANTQIGQQLWHQRIKSFGVVNGRRVEICAEYFAKCLTEPDRLWSSQHYQKTQAGQASSVRAERNSFHSQILFRAFAPVSRFSFVCDGGSAILFRLTCRRPKSDFREDAEGPCRITLNGVGLIEIALRREWQGHEFTALPDLLRRGMNTLELRWPLTGLDSGDLRLEEIAAGMEREAFNAITFMDLYPVFGEIHSFWATLPENDTAKPVTSNYHTEHSSTNPSRVGPGFSLVPDQRYRYA